jgi:hypothetical protein
MGRLYYGVCAVFYAGEGARATLSQSFPGFFPFRPCKAEFGEILIFCGLSCG